MISPLLINSKFKLFQWKSKRFSGLNFSDILPTNIIYCQSLSNSYLATRHIDLITWYLKWKLKKSGILLFPTPNVYPLTKKPVEVRMGKGKGAITDWAIPIKKNGIPFFFQGKRNTMIKILFSNLLKKLPFWAKISESQHSLKELTFINTYFSKNFILKNKYVQKCIFK